jgi:CheY-like chemotaxis protein
VLLGLVRLRAERLDLARLVRTAAEDQRAVLAQAGVSLEVEAPETPVWVEGDATRLTQALNNLLDNAVKFTAPGGSVAVRLGADSGAGQAVLTVSDTGAGIEPGVLPRLFVPFSQAEQGLDRQRGGLGLGLAVVKGLVELHGGGVAAASAGPGRGATFTVRLPLGKEPPALSVLPKRASACGRRSRILVVEDNKDSADSLQVLLSVLGHEVRVASTGPAGVQSAFEWLPDVVLCDIGLPGFDGFEVARRLRRQPGLEGALLVALTGYGGPEDRRRGLEAGFDHYLTKPTDPADLQRLLAARVA